MSRDLNKEFSDTEDRKYAYAIDYLIHDMILRTFSDYFVRELKVLELGCYKGEFTKKLLQLFDDVTVVDGSSELISEAGNNVGNAATFVEGRFEDVQLDKKFDAVFLCHTLEHLDDPGLVLKNIGRWLSDTGKLFIVVPNANAASRQIAVSMGLIDFNSAVTQGEYEHGHRKTYSLDTLVHEAKNSGLTVLDQGGIFFKPLANYQIDRALREDIITLEFLEGCFALGKKYPDLCASIYAVCTKGG